MIDLVDGLGTKLDPFALGEDGGVDLKRQIIVELPHCRCRPRNKGRTKSLSAAVLNSEVEERISGGETAFWDERAVEQRLLLDSLGLLRNERMWIF